MEENKYYSIPEFAKKVGVSRQSIYKALSTKLSTYVVNQGDKKMLRAEALCEYNCQPTVNQVVNQTVNQVDSSFSGEKDFLYEILREELNYKNKLIDELRIELSEERKHSREQSDKLATLASQAQYLQLEQKTGQENDSISIIEQPIEILEEPKEEKVGFWKKIFKR